ncbi:MAG: HDOD domain-containing protein [Desulfovibrionaceae bacterium]|nr:HDOD domain-containing protein [Desulfovibrionaceae bacterium]
MILARELKTRDGRLLLPAKAAISERQLELIKKQCDGEAQIETPKPEVGAQDLAQGDEYVRRYFMFVDHGDTVIDELFRVAVTRTAERIAEGWSPPGKEALLGLGFENLRDKFFKQESTLKDIVNDEVQVSAFSDIYFKLNEVLKSPKSSASDVASIVSTDPGLSAKLLKIVNSPFYSFSAEIDSVSRAVALVGGQELLTLAIGVTAINYFKDIPPELVDMKTFWRHSISCGIIAKAIAERVPGLAVERYFTAGLLHDVGRLIIFKKQPYASVQALIYARENYVPLVEAERAVLGFDHSKVGHLLLKAWRFPALLNQMVTYHHEPGSSPNKLDASVIHVADNIANALGISAGAMFVLPGIEPGAWERLKLPLKAIESIVKTYDEQISEIEEAFF